jgi:hypothetical protein
MKMQQAAKEGPATATQPQRPDAPTAHDAQLLPEHSLTDIQRDGIAFRVGHTPATQDSYRWHGHAEILRRSMG